MPPANYREARPRTPEEAARLQHCPGVTDTATERGITQAVHFTTLKGVIGAIASGFVKSRARLPYDKHLEYVYQPNALFRKDTEWLDYVNLSVERINDWMFSTSVRWHAHDGNPWVVLSFDPQILAHPGVVFTTTNNIYPACHRAEGLTGFNQMFAEVVFGRYNSRHDRRDKIPAWPTDRQAEVLYPGELSCDYLQRITVQTEDAVDTIHGMFGGLPHSREVPVIHDPEAFR